MAKFLPTQTTIAIGGDKIIGTATGITFATSRHKLPIYTLGTVSPLGYARGRRIVTGVLYNVVISGALFFEAVLSNMIETLIAGYDGSNFNSEDEGVQEVVEKAITRINFEKFGDKSTNISGDISLHDRLEVIANLILEEQKRTNNSNFIDGEGNPKVSVNDIIKKLQKLYPTIDVKEAAATVLPQVLIKKPAIFLDEVKNVDLYLWHIGEDMTDDTVYYTKIIDVQFMSNGTMVSVDQEAIIEEIRFVGKGILAFVPTKFS